MNCRFNKMTIDNLQTQNIINAIPGGVVIYKVSDIFETIYFSDGVSTLSGYTPEAYAELMKQDAANLIHPDDRVMAVAKIREALDTNTAASFEFRTQHSNGQIVWVSVYAKKIGESAGYPLLQCVFHNISDLKQTQEELNHLINSIPGGIAAYDFHDLEHPKRILCSDGLATLFACTDKADMEIYFPDPWKIVFHEDLQRVRNAFDYMHKTGEAVNISYRIVRKDSIIEWIHLNGTLSDGIFYAVYTGMSEEAKLFQQISNETAQGIYVIDRGNYNLLYYNENKPLFLNDGGNVLGQKCYAALHGLAAPCPICPLLPASENEQRQELLFPNGRTYEIRSKTLPWRGIPAYILYVNDVTDRVKSTLKTQRLEQFYQTLIRNLPGGIAVLRIDQENGLMLPEFISEGFAEMTGMTITEARALYENDATAGVHPEDVPYALATLQEHLKENLDTCESIYRLRKGDGSYIWVKNNSSLITDVNGAPLIYAIYSDITKEITEQERLRQKYNDVLFRQKNFPLENEILSGYCNISKNKIIRVYDKTGNDLLERFGSERQHFFRGFASLIENDLERERFLAKFLNQPLLAAFAKGVTADEFECFLRLPQDHSGHYVKCTITMIEAPDSGDTIGVLSVIDVTQRRIDENLSMRLAHTHYDFIVVADLEQDRYSLLFDNNNTQLTPPHAGSYSEEAVQFLQKFVVPKDREFCLQMFDPAYIKERLQHDSSYSFHYSMQDSAGNVYMKNMIIYLVDKRLQKFGFACSDITESVREQRALLNTLAYTFEQLGIINLLTREFTMYTRKSVLQNLPPYKCRNFENALRKLTAPYLKSNAPEEVEKQFAISTILERLSAKPQGYEFILSYRSLSGIEYHKQLNMLWGDDNHHTICLVRCDVTDIITAEQKSREILQNTLKLAQEANQAKSDFLSSMSHDIRTPMNAIIGMTDLALENVGTQMPTSEYLQIIKSSSMHLLTLINDILDMSRIEKGKLIIEHRPFNLALEIDRFCSRNQVLMNKKQLQFRHSTKLQHENVLGDVLHLQRIWDNIISNAIKFTPEGGTVSFEVCELPHKNSHIGYYQFVISDTGIGIDKNSLSQLFDPFYRSNEVVSNHIEGSGLGLAIVKNIVDYKGGTIKVESTPGQGTSFIITLPLHFDTSPASGTLTSAVKAASTAADFDFSGKHILLVEDHPINQQVAELVLQKTGAQITIANNGAEGSEMFEASVPGSFDAILMDIQMPVMNGYEATKVIRSSTHPQSATIPIIAMTANAFAEDIKNALEAGMNEHIAKPIDPQKLYETLATYIK